MAKASAMVVSRLYRLSSVSLFLHGCSAADAVVKPSSRCLHILSSARTRVCVCMCTCTRARLCSAVKIILFMTISNHVIHSSGTNRSKACNQTLHFSCGRVWPRQTSRTGRCCECVSLSRWEMLCVCLPVALGDAASVCLPVALGDAVCACLPVALGDAASVSPCRAGRCCECVSLSCWEMVIRL